MGRTISRARAALDFSRMSDAARQALLSGIEQLAPTSPLYVSSPAIQASFAALVKKGTALLQSTGTVTADRAKLLADIELEVGARTAFDVEARSLATLSQAAATTPADLTSMGFAARSPVVIAKAPPAVPDAIDVRIPKRGRGLARVVAVYSGSGKPHFLAETSPDPVTATSWSSLPGAGRTRNLTGASGARVWVRFAAMRGQVQSDWCTPVLVTIP